MFIMRTQSISKSWRIFTRSKPQKRIVTSFLRLWMLNCLNPRRVARRPRNLWQLLRQSKRILRIDATNCIRDIAFGKPKLCDTLESSRCSMAPRLDLGSRLLLGVRELLAFDIN
jgi:hypothetical protein